MRWRKINHKKNFIRLFLKSGPPLSCGIIYDSIGRQKTGAMYSLVQQRADAGWACSPLGFHLKLADGCCWAVLSESLPNLRLYSTFEPKKAFAKG